MSTHSNNLVWKIILIEGVSISSPSGKIANKTCQMSAHTANLEKEFLKVFASEHWFFFYGLLARFYCYISDQL